MTSGVAGLDVLRRWGKYIWCKTQDEAMRHPRRVITQAIALRLGHRESVDFDFFSERPLDKRAARAISPLFEQAGVLQDEPETLTLAVPMPGTASPVKVSFFGGITFGRLGGPESLKALVYFKGGDLDTLPAAQRRVLTEAVAAVGDLPAVTLRARSLAARDTAAKPPRRVAQAR